MGRVRAAQKLSGTIRELGERKAGGKRLSGKNIYSQTPDRGAKRGRKVIRLLYPVAKRALRSFDNYKIFLKNLNCLVYFRNQFCRIVFKKFIWLMIFESCVLKIYQKKMHFEKILKSFLQILKKYFLIKY